MGKQGFVYLFHRWLFIMNDLIKKTGMKKRIILTTIGIWVMAFSFGQNIQNLKLDNRQSILNDRAFFNFPAGANNVARQTDIMSADPNTNKETRIILDIDKQRLVFFARELFVTSDESSFFRNVSKDDGDNYKSKILLNKDTVTAVLTTPLTFDSQKNAILVNSLLVRTPDGTIFSIGAYINPDAFKNKNEFQKLSENVFASLTKGNRKQNFKARTEVFKILGGKKSFSIDLPDGYVVNKDASYDFEVLKFEKIKDMADTTWQSLTIYTGSYPSYFYGDEGFDAKDAEKINGKFLGQSVEWLFFKNAKKQFYLKEQKIPSDKIEKGLIVHMAMLGNNQIVITELTSLIENIKVIDN